MRPTSTGLGPPSWSVRPRAGGRSAACGFVDIRTTSTSWTRRAGGRDDPGDGRVQFAGRPPTAGGPAHVPRWRLGAPGHTAAAAIRVGPLPRAVRVAGAGCSATGAPGTVALPLSFRGVVRRAAPLVRPTTPPHLL